MGLTNNTEFLSRLSEILSANAGESSVYLTQKRLVPALDVDENNANSDIRDLPSSVVPNEANLPENNTQYPLLVRVTNGASKKSKTAKVKLSTVVEVDRLDEFWSEYINVIKNGFVGLKKKNKKRTKKGKVSK